MQSNNTGEDVHEATPLPPSWIPDNLLKSSDTENQKKKYPFRAREYPILAPKLQVKLFIYSFDCNYDHKIYI